MAVALADMPKIITRHFGADGLNHIDAAIKAGGYATLNKAFGMAPGAITDEVKKSNLRGRGGAGFPTGMKWGFIPKDAKTVYLVVNADESEPGTCKDREILFWDPHLLIEGVIIASYALGCAHAYIYIRGEMIREHVVLQRAVDQAYEKGYLGQEQKTQRAGWKLDVTVHRGAGAYICGEETALLNSLEGKRGWPRLKPPFPAVKGLFGQPTIVNNVETLCNVPAIVDKGGQWFADLGTPKSGGTRILCVSGHVARPGVYELPMGIPLRAVIDDICGGVPGGKKVKAVIPGGSSMPPLDADELDVPMEFDALMTDERIKPVMARPGVTFDLGPGKPLRTMAGSGGVIVMDEDTDIPRVLWRIIKFYAHESCGQCTPCREGTGWLERVTRRLADGNGRAGDVELCASIAVGIAGNTICPLGEAAAWPMLGFLTKFRADFEARIRPGAAPEPPPAQSGLVQLRAPSSRRRALMAFAPAAAATAQLVAESELPTDGARIAFWAILGTLVLGGALLTVTRKNAVAAVMSLVATFFGLAACYALLYAHFLAALQVLVYAGAIMVLFIFVVMVLNRDEYEPWAWRGVLLKGFVGVPALVYVVVKLSYHVQRFTPPHPEAPPLDFGTVANVGEILFTDYLFAFEAVSVLLLIAVIAAVVVARTHKPADDEADKPAIESGHS